MNVLSLIYFTILKAHSLELKQNIIMNIASNSFVAPNSGSRLPSPDTPGIMYLNTDNGAYEVKGNDGTTFSYDGKGTTKGSTFGSNPETGSSQGGLRGGISMPKLPSTGNPIADAVLNKVAQAAADKALEAGAPYIAETVETIGETIGNIFGQQRDAGNSGGDGGSIGVGRPTPDGIFHQIQASINHQPNPVETALKTGLVPNIYGTYYQSTHDDSNMPIMMLMRGKISMSGNSADPIRKYFENVIFSEICSSIQGAISFALPSCITKSSLADYFTAVANGLSVYVFIDSILTYCSDPVNNNLAMLDLRSKITASDMNAFYQLKRQLGSTPIPPNLRTLVYWINQTFTTGTLPGCPLIKYAPFDIMDLSTNSITYVIQSAISDINIKSDVISVLARAVSKWIVPNLPSSNQVPLHDLQFNTLWANRTHVTNKNSNLTTLYQYPTYSSISEASSYCTFTDKIDGAILALDDNLFTTTSSWAPSLWVPDVFSIGSNFDSRAVYWNNSGTVAWTTGYGMANHSNPFGNLYTVASTEGIIKYPYGSEVVLGATIASELQTAYRLVDWLWTLGSIGNLKDNKEYKQRPTNLYAQTANNNQTKGKQNKGGRHVNGNSGGK